MDAAIRQKVIDNIAAGIYLEDFCGTDGIPSVRTIQRRIQEDPDFGAQCAHAREISARLTERRISQIVDSTLSDEVKPDAARVAINALTWIAKVRAPRQYGDQLDVKHSGSVNVSITGRDADVL